MQICVMKVMKIICHAAILFLLVTTSVSRASDSQRITGLVKREKRQIDFRYPDYIVKPRVPCPKEGFFMHPRDCRWFYRCFARLPEFPNFYWRAYFQCPPGLVFSEELSTCILGTAKEQCGPTTCETTVTQNCRACNPAPPKVMCEANDFCYRGESLVSKRQTCTPGNAWNYDIATKKCNQDKCDECSTFFVCFRGSHFPENHPSVKNLVCNLKTNSSVTTPVDGEVKTICKECYDCPIEDPLFSTYKKMTSCRTGEVYSVEKEVCLNGETGKLQTTLKAHPKPPVLDAGAPAIFQCSSPEFRPNNLEIRQMLCKEYEICKSTEKLMKTLCFAYFECELENGNLVPSLQSCMQPDYMYSYEENQCIQRPLDSELCI